MRHRRFRGDFIFEIHVRMRAKESGRFVPLQTILPAALEVEREVFGIEARASQR